MKFCGILARHLFNLKKEGGTKIAERMKYYSVGSLKIKLNYCNEVTLSGLVVNFLYKN